MTERHGSKKSRVFIAFGHGWEPRFWKFYLPKFLEDVLNVAVSFLLITMSPHSCTHGNQTDKPFWTDSSLTFQPKPVEHLFSLLSNTKLFRTHLLGPALSQRPQIAWDERSFCELFPTKGTKTKSVALSECTLWVYIICVNHRFSSKSQFTSCTVLFSPVQDERENRIIKKIFGFALCVSFWFVYAVVDKVGWRQRHRDYERKRE